MAAPIYRRLGAKSPTGTTEVTVAIVPGGKQWIAATLTLANITTSAVKVTVKTKVGGSDAVNPNDDLFLKNVTVQPGTTPLVRGGLTLAGTDTVTVQCDTANGVTVQLYGTELS